MQRQKPGIGFVRLSRQGSSKALNGRLRDVSLNQQFYKPARWDGSTPADDQSFTSRSSEISDATAVHPLRQADIYMYILQNRSHRR